jgi:ABC-2 type transport system permease protein
MLEIGVAYAIAVAVGGTAYVLGFIALSTLTSRALAVGLGYVLLWEGILSGLLEGTRVFSVRQATIGIAAALSDAVPSRQGVVDTGPALAFLVVVIGASLALTTWRLSRYESRGGD